MFARSDAAGHLFLPFPVCGLGWAGLGKARRGKGAEGMYRHKRNKYRLTWGGFAPRRPPTETIMEED